VTLNRASSRGRLRASGTKLTSVQNNGTTAFNGGAVTTTAGQTYNGAVALGANTVLNGTAVTFENTVAGGNNNLTLGNSGAATLNGAVSGVNTLAATGSGTLAVNNTISAGSVNDSENTTLNVAGTIANPSVITTAGQTYGGLVNLKQNTVLENAVNISGNTISIGTGSINANGNQLFFYFPPNIVDVFGLQDETLKRMLGAILPAYQPTEVKRQKPVQPGPRMHPTPWIITLPMNSLEVPFN